MAVLSSAERQTEPPLFRGLAELQLLAYWKEVFAYYVEHKRRRTRAAFNQPLFATHPLPFPTSTIPPFAVFYHPLTVKLVDSIYLDFADCREREGQRFMRSLPGACPHHSSARRR